MRLHDRHSITDVHRNLSTYVVRSCGNWAVNNARGKTFSISKLNCNPHDAGAEKRGQFFALDHPGPGCTHPASFHSMGHPQEQ
jgi:hypothetical protein